MTEISPVTVRHELKTDSVVNSPANSWLLVVTEINWIRTTAATFMTALVIQE